MGETRREIEVSAMPCMILLEIVCLGTLRQGQDGTPGVFSQKVDDGHSFTGREGNVSMFFGTLRQDQDGTPGVFPQS